MQKQKLKKILLKIKEENQDFINDAFGCELENKDIDKIIRTKLDLKYIENYYPDLYEKIIEEYV